jgi:hypothetical protein
MPMMAQIKMPRANKIRRLLRTIKIAYCAPDIRGIVEFRALTYNTTLTIAIAIKTTLTIKAKTSNAIESTISFLLIVILILVYFKFGL